MIIYGIGTDIVSLKRIKSSLKKKNFIKRIFDEKEIDLASSYFEKNFPGWVIKKTKLNDF